MEAFGYHLAALNRSVTVRQNLNLSKRLIKLASPTGQLQTAECNEERVYYASRMARETQVMLPAEW